MRDGHAAGSTRRHRDHASITHRVQRSWKHAPPVVARAFTVVVVAARARGMGAVGDCKFPLAVGARPWPAPLDAASHI